MNVALQGLQVLSSAACGQLHVPAVAIGAAKPSPIMKLKLD